MIQACSEYAQLGAQWMGDYLNGILHEIAVRQDHAGICSYWKIVTNRHTLEDIIA